jgi:hypothetical protein
MLDRAVTRRVDAVQQDRRVRIPVHPVRLDKPLAPARRQTASSPDDLVPKNIFCL